MQGSVRNTKILYEAREKVINFFDDYSIIVSETKHESFQIEILLSNLATRIKISTPKQRSRRLPIALAKKQIMPLKAY